MKADDLIEVPCEYQGAETAPCENGQVLIYGEMGGRPPETVTCPECGGTGKVKMTRMDILERIADLDDERDILEKEIGKWKSCLNQ